MADPSHAPWSFWGSGHKMTIACQPLQGRLAGDFTPVLHMRKLRLKRGKELCAGWSLEPGSPDLSEEGRVQVPVLCVVFPHTLNETCFRMAEASAGKEGRTHPSAPKSLTGFPRSTVGQARGPGEPERRSTRGPAGREKPGERGWSRPCRTMALGGPVPHRRVPPEEH